MKLDRFAIAQKLTGMVRRPAQRLPVPVYPPVTAASQRADAAQARRFPYWRVRSIAHAVAVFEGFGSGDAPLRCEVPSLRSALSVRSRCNCI